MDIKNFLFLVPQEFKEDYHKTPLYIEVFYEFLPTVKMPYVREVVIKFDDLRHIKDTQKIVNPIYHAACNNVRSIGDESEYIESLNQIGLTKKEVV